ncbi:MAG: hypothetical protein ACRDL3_00860 [Solirubrobacterales bacterium]
MARRYVILTAAVVLAVAIAVPAIGENADPVAVSSKASKKSKRALKQAKRAKRKARQANRTAKLASELASEIQADLESTRVVSDTEAGQVTTTSESYVSRGGPTVTVTVPASGMIEVWAQFDTTDADGGAISLYEDGQQVPGQADCDPDVQNSLALVEGGGGPPGNPITAGTPAALDVALGCLTTGAPGPVLFQRPPGEHTYELRYADPCPCVGSVFSNRILRIAPRL